MTKKEREILKNDIAMKNEMTKKIGSWAKNLFLIFLLFGAIAFWGFSGMSDSFLQVSDTIRDILKWIGLVLAILSGLATVLVFTSFRNSKKHVFQLIAKMESSRK